MRVYFEKPRTTTGWKGLINDPHLDDSGDVNTGLRMARRLLLEILDLGLPVGCEFLDPITPQYISDAVAWGAIGARTTESQIHRQLGSGLSMPVGFKNRHRRQRAGGRGRRAGGLGAARLRRRGRDRARRRSSTRKGNPDCHVILRGGKGAPNYGAEAVQGALEMLRAANLPERVVIDASHDNSGKDHQRQPAGRRGRGRPARGGQQGDRGRDARVVPGRRPPGAGPATPAHLRPVDHRRVHGLGHDLGVLEGLAAAVRARRTG